MSEERWIVIPRWDEFQHPDVARSKQAPPWIRIYVRLLDDESYMALSLAQRGLLHGLWMLYARQRRVLNYDTSRRLLSTNKGESRHFANNLKALCDAGFVVLLASNLQAQTETETEISVSSKAEALTSYAGAAARKNKAGKQRPTELPPELIERVSRLRGADENTARVVASFAARGLPEAAFRNALEATQEASMAGRLSTTEVKYLVGTLKHLEEGGQYG